jgi:asparagine synthase (glutamine-hydrolysing)
MCGLIGFIDYEKEIKINDLDRATDKMYLRGPEARGTILLENDAYEIGLGHRRLAILDLDERSNQPFKDNDTYIIFNGEIYNFQTLKEQLTELGHNFSTSSDTEVILKAFKQWGNECFSRFIGMFAICIFEQKKELVTIVRDRLGIKPLYIYQNNKRLVFSSETKSIISLLGRKLEIDKAALHGYFSLGYIPGDHSIYEGIKKVKEGTITKIDLQNFQPIRSIKYWDINDYASEGTSFNSDQSHLESLIEDAVKLRLVADVEVGSFLSGGLDSSYITKVMSDLQQNKATKSFTIGFDASFDEAPHAQKVADYIGTNHTSYYLKPEDISEILFNYSDYFDDPFSDDAAVPMLYLSRKSKSTVKVVISSDGGDELFAGYNRYSTALNVNKKLSLIPTFSKGMIRNIVGMAYDILPKRGNSSNFLWRLKNILDTDNTVQLANILFYGDRIPSAELNQLISKDVLNCEFSHNYYNAADKKLSNIKQLLAIDIRESLVNQMLVKVDKSTMGSSIEGREPLLDHRLFEFMFAKPDLYFAKKGVNKYIFREIIFKKFQDKEILNKPKMGFNTPILQWLKEYYSEHVEEEINSIVSEEIPYLNEKKLKLFWQEYKSGNIHYQHLLWRVLIYINWYKRQFKPNIKMD